MILYTAMRVPVMLSLVFCRWTSDLYRLLSNCFQGSVSEIKMPMKIETIYLFCYSIEKVMIENFAESYLFGKNFYLDYLFSVNNLSKTKEFQYIN